MTFLLKTIKKHLPYPLQIYFSNWVLISMIILLKKAKKHLSYLPRIFFSNWVLISMIFLLNIANQNHITSHNLREMNTNYQYLKK
ncbi:hypothetical protein CUC44_12290 [Aeromonas lusitana]|uniref:Uncharacterized protein n=1 Tax=Aeromonas lusitana TaxID=931529 RepID=A0A2M8H8N0_9GAMM|nr:hypothetical protein CUC44_12290 [Aeromonas lusitana]